MSSIVCSNGSNSPGGATLFCTTHEKQVDSVHYQILPKCDKMIQISWRILKMSVIKHSGLIFWANLYVQRMTVSQQLQEQITK